MKKLTSVMRNCNYGNYTTYRTAIMGVAAIFIIICHTYNFCPDMFSGTSIIQRALGAFIEEFNMGVDIFLFVSGIGLYYAYEKKPRFKEYYIKRVITVYPMLLLVHFFRSLFSNIIFDSNGIIEFFTDFTGVSFWLGSDRGGWYVMFVLVMYAVYPLVYKFLKVIENKKYESVIFLFLVGAYSVALYLSRDFKIYELYNICLTRIPVFLLGCFCGHYVKSERKFGAFFYIGVIFGVLIKILALCSGDYYFKKTSNFLFVLAVTYILIVAFLLLPESFNKFFEFFGKISLELYLVHCAIFKCVMFFSELCTLPMYLIITIIAIPVSYYLSKLRQYIVDKYLDSLKNDKLKQKTKV